MKASVSKIVPGPTMVGPIIDTGDTRECAER